MKDKNEFYKAFFEALARLGYDVRKSTSADYYADIYQKDRLVAFYLTNDTIERNPFVVVADKIMDEITGLARATALRCGICTEKPYTGQNPKLPDGAYLLSQFRDVVLAAKQHPLFDYVFRTYRLSPDGVRPIQTQYYYNKAEALEQFSFRAGLVDARKLFTESELILIHDQLVRFQISPNNDKTVEEFQTVCAAIERVEELVPALREREIMLDYAQEFEQDLDWEQHQDAMEMEAEA